MRIKTIKALLFGVSLAVLISIATTPVSAEDNPANCQQLNPISVQLSPTNPTPYNVVTWLCAQGPVAGKTMQIAVHGLTYDHQYWNWPQAPQKYSYAQSATQAGYAVLAIDRIGDGQSSHPTNGASVTAEAGGYVLHQIVQQVRSGSITGSVPPKVMTAGHSFGSIIAAYEAGTYHDVDGVILSGYMHDVSPGGLTSLASFYPAFLDPKFAFSGLNTTYMTTVPGSRTALFFNPANTQQGVIDKDEALKQTATVGEFSSLFASHAVTPSIDVPVLLAIGDQDFLFCDTNLGLSCQTSQAILDRENSHFAGEACLEAFVQTDSGHSINLHRNAQSWFAAANDWSNRRVGQNASTPATQPCQS